MNSLDLKIITLSAWQLLQQILICSVYYFHILESKNWIPLEISGERQSVGFDHILVSIKVSFLVTFRWRYFTHFFISVSFDLTTTIHIDYFISPFKYFYLKTFLLHLYFISIQTFRVGALICIYKKWGAKKKSKISDAGMFIRPTYLILMGYSVYYLRDQMVGVLNC